MPTLTSAEKSDLAEHISWCQWGEQFGFRLYGSNGKWAATFKLKDGLDFHVPQAARIAIDAKIANG